jgi:hypothetical protein
VRLLLALGIPLKIGFNKDVTSHIELIHKKLTEINDEALRLLHKRNFEMQNEIRESHDDVQRLRIAMEKLSEENKKLRIDITAKNSATDRQMLEGIREMLHVEFSSPETSVEKCMETLSLAFKSIISGQQHFMLMASKDLYQSSEYRSWSATSASCILYLAGQTYSESRTSFGYTHSWLSPAAMQVARDIQQRDGRLAFFSCHPDIQGDHYSPQNILASLLLQILDWKPAALRGIREQLMRQIKSVAKWNLGVTDTRTRKDKQIEQKSDRKEIKNMCNILGQALVAIARELQEDSGNGTRDASGEQGTLNSKTSSRDDFSYIIIDRIDLCHSKMKYLIEGLAEKVITEPSTFPSSPMVSRSPSSTLLPISGASSATAGADAVKTPKNELRVKIMIVAETGPNDWDPQDNVNDDWAKCIFARKNWDQERLMY